MICNCPSAFPLITNQTMETSSIATSDAGYFSGGRDVSDDEVRLKYSPAVEPIVSKTLQLQPDCLEFAPANISSTVYSPFLSKFAAEYFVIGTYLLVESSTVDEDGEPTNSRPQEKRGGLSLFRLQGNTLSGEEDTSRDYGVYDLKFLPYHPIFAAATTLGKILICQLEEIGEPEQKDLQIKEVSSHQVIPENITICSVAWFPLQHASDGTRILAFTVEDGRVFLVRFRDDFKSFDFLNGQLPVHQHFDKTPVSNNAERAWCCAFSRPRPDSVMSGGDDSVLRRSTLNFPQDLTTLQEDSSLWSVVTDLALYREKRFPQGVTAILPFPFCTPECSSTIFLVGCYDSSVGLWSVYGKDVPEAEVNLGGGVYRLKFLQYEPGPPEQVACTFQVLASCMDAGTKILEVKRSISGHWFIDVVAEVKDHQDLCYAADVQPLPAPGDGEAPITCLEERICVSSSFKDCKLSVWKFNPLHVSDDGGTGLQLSEVMTTKRGLLPLLQKLYIDERTSIDIKDH